MSARAIDRQQLDAFVDKCLEPLPDEVLVDTHMNRLLRSARQAAWWEADTATEIARLKLDLFRAMHRRVRMPSEERELLRAYRAAKAKQLLVPAHDKACLSWKRRAANDDYLPVSKDEIDAAIAADEAFLASHPTTRRGAVSPRLT